MVVFKPTIISCENPTTCSVITNGDYFTFINKIVIFVTLDNEENFVTYLAWQVYPFRFILKKFTISLRILIFPSAVTHFVM